MTETESLPFVSVLMTAFNREDFIGFAIESVLQSEFKNFELIIVDDVSTDKSFSLATDYSQRDNRIKVFRNEKNLGDYQNRNYAASLAQGKYLKYVDSDDSIPPHGLGTMVKMMEEHPSAGMGISVKNSKGIEKFPVQLGPRESYLMHYNTNPVFFASPGDVIFRKDHFLSAGGFRPLRMVGDFDMWHRMAVRSPIILLPPGLYNYRKHGSQEINSFANYLIQYEEIKVHYLLGENSPVSKDEARDIIRSRMKTLVKIILDFVVRLKWKSAGYRIKVLSYYLKNYTRIT